MPRFPGIGRVVSGTVGALPDALGDDERLVVLAAPDGWRPDPDPRVEVIELEASATSVAQQWQVRRLLRRLTPAGYHSFYVVMPYLTPAPTVVTVHDLIPRHSLPGGGPRQRLLFEVALRCALRAADAVVTVSEATAAELVRRGDVRRERLTVVSPGVGTPFSPRPEAEVAAVREALGLGRAYALYVGMNKPHKGLSVLLDAVARRPREDLELVVAGPHDDRFPLAPHSVDAARLRYVGRVPDRQLAALYSGTAMVVVPSLDEGFGLPALEALACGAPLVASSLPALQEVAGDVAAWVPAGDAEALAATMSALLADDRRRAALAAAGPNRARRFSWAAAAARTLDVYRKVANDGPTHGRA